MTRTTALAILALCAAGPALAQTAATDEARYTIVEGANGIVRVDRETGAVDYCRTVGTGQVCQLAPQERLEWQRETERLSDTVSELERRIARLESDGVPGSGTKTPSDDEVDKALGTAERFLRGFFDIVRSLRQDEKTDTF